MPSLPSSLSDSDQTADRNDHLNVCARLLASGDLTWPENLSVEETLRLEQMVREYRRKRLVALIASCIAAEIAADGGEGGKL